LEAQEAEEAKDAEDEEFSLWPGAQGRGGRRREGSASR
jgi:hypothetical protein